jgi:hypothetical protein
VDGVTMRSLLLVAGDSARWAGSWLVAARGGAGPAAASPPEAAA